MRTSNRSAAASPLVNLSRSSIHSRDYETLVFISRSTFLCFVSTARTLNECVSRPRKRNKHRRLSRRFGRAKEAHQSETGIQGVWSFRNPFNDNAKTQERQAKDSQNSFHSQSPSIPCFLKSRACVFYEDLGGTMSARASASALSSDGVSRDFVISRSCHSRASDEMIGVLNWTVFRFLSGHTRKARSDGTRRAKELAGTNDVTLYLALSHLVSGYWVFPPLTGGNKREGEISIVVLRSGQGPRRGGISQAQQALSLRFQNCPLQ